MPTGAEITGSPEWITKSVETVRTLPNLDEPEQLTKLRALVQGATNEDLGKLAEQLKAEQLTLSEPGAKEVAIRVRENLANDPEALRRLELLGGRVALLEIVSQHLKPSFTNKVSTVLGKYWRKLTNTPNALGQLARRTQEQIASGAPSFQQGLFNYLKKGLFYAAEFPGMIAGFTGLPNLPFLSKFAGHARKMRTKIEAEELVYKVAHESGHNNFKFSGLNGRQFDQLVNKHLPKDENGMVKSKEFTSEIRAKVLSQVELAARKVLAKQPTIKPADIINLDETLKLQAQAETDKFKAKVSEHWNGFEATKIEFGKVTEYKEGKLFLRKAEDLDGDGQAKSPEAKLLQRLMKDLPNKDIKIAAKDKPLEVRENSVTFPLHRTEPTAGRISDMQLALNNLKTASVAREVANETEQSTITLLLDKEGAGVLAYSSVQFDQLVQFAEDKVLQEDDAVGTKWKLKGGEWQKQ